VAFPRPKQDLASADKALRNIWSFVSVPMAVNEVTCKDRVNACAETIKRLKTSPHALIQLFLQNELISRAPKAIAQQICQDACTRHSMVFSNVPGPSEHIFFAGERVEDMRIVFPNILPQVIVMSYAGGVYYTLSIDPEAVETELLPKLFLEELTELAQELGVKTAMLA
jgi:hypothetical protein